MDNISIRDLHPILQKFQQELHALCKKNAYNLVLHKHLGDVCYEIGTRAYFEAKYGIPLHFIVRPQHEFLMRLFGVKSYTVYPMKWFEDYASEADLQYIPFAFYKSDKFEALCRDTLYSIPVLDVPFIADSSRNSLGKWDHYWCYFWAHNMGISPNFRFEVPKNKLTLSKDAMDKLKAIAPLDKIVLFAPEAQTFPEFSESFWNHIAEVVHAHGYTVIVNSKKHKIKHGISAFDLGLSLEDVCALGLNCAYVFSLRSGLCDVLVGAGERLYAFYPAQGRREMYGLNRVFAQPTHVKEIQIWNWKIDPVIWNGVDLTPQLQREINKLHRKYNREAVRFFFSLGNRRRRHRFWKNLMRDLAGKSKVFRDNNIDNPKPCLKKNIKLFLLPIYKQQAGTYSWATERRHSLLGGILYLKTDSNKNQILRFCGLTIYSRKRNNGYLTFRVFGMPLYRKDLRPQFLDKIVATVDDAHDDIYLIRQNIGETYIYLAHIKDWIKKNKSKNPVIIVWRRKDVPLYKMFVPEGVSIRYMESTTNEIHSVFAMERVEYKGHRIFCPIHQIIKTLKTLHMQDSKTNFYTHICKDFVLPKPDKLALPKIDPTVLKEIDTRIAMYFKRPFVVILPNATTLSPLSQDFWYKLAQGMQSIGYDVFINGHVTAQDHLYEIPGTVTFNPNIEEMFALASKSAGIISLASGIAVLLTATGRPADLIYTDFRTHKPKVSSSLGRAMYSVYNIPGVSPDIVKEHDIANHNEQELLDIIINRYRKMSN